MGKAGGWSLGAGGREERWERPGDGPWELGAGRRGGKGRGMVPGSWGPGGEGGHYIILFYFSYLIIYNYYQDIKEREEHVHVSHRHPYNHNTSQPRIRSALLNFISRIGCIGCFHI